MNSVADWLVQNRDKIEKGVEIMGQASEVLAATVGQLHPVLEAVFVASAELLSNPDSKEARYLTQQFELVNQKLEGIQDEIDKLALELQRTSMNKQNFDREAQMLSQYEKFQDFVNAKPKFKEKKMEKFISHYENTDMDVNLDALYNAVTGENTSGDPMLDIVVATEQRSRRAVEDFCAQLKKLFVVGIIAVMGYAALKEGGVGEEMVTKWQGRMEEVEKRMKAAVDDCTENFAQQAKLDIEHLVQENPGIVDQGFTKSILDALARKYDWVNWSIRAFNDRERIFFFNWLAGKKYHGSGGANWFDLLTKTKIKVVVSFCVDPKPINKSQIQEQIEQQKLKGNMMAVALALNKSFPNCLVHAVSHYKAVVESNNFQGDCYYFGKHKRAYLCIHPE
ncbi:rapunzel 5 [Archocentrus centrarchus]|uniref:Rapunzel 5 n=1 Tax=Amphilophus citrinellus TaxID=61819 RepID=A0A3Q0SCB5_AMPCI|nr:protein rapunzel-like [Archocentrus centrarchus]XP_030605285.1 protein rapunzel-like [Archocentrus centrarchus]XP_030605286.1 protein rapunzel-like [Archocentrus centrarchus]